MAIEKQKTIGRYPALQNWIDDFWDTTKNFGEGLISKFNLPAVNIREKDNTYLIEVAAPGMKKNDFTIEVDENILTIFAEHKDEEIEEKDNYMRKEFNYNSFKRSFTLPNNVSNENIKAKYKEGVLFVTLEKVEVENPNKRIVEIS